MKFGRKIKHIQLEFAHTKLLFKHFFNISFDDNKFADDKNILNMMTAK